MPDVHSTAATSAIVADDDEFFRIALASILSRQLGFAEVHETASLDEALNRLDASGGAAPVTLALFDLSMPGMESAASLLAVRECYPGTRVVVVSASNARHDILQALSAGVHGYVPKGLGAAELSRALQSILDGNIFVPPSLAEFSYVRSSKSAWERQGILGDPGMASQARFVGQTDAFTMLTQRQKEVLHLLIEGRSNKEIARALKLREGTVKVHVAALFRNLGVQNRSAAAVAGARLIRATSHWTEIEPI